MTATFDKATIKVWFKTLSTSRNFYNTTEIIQEGNAVLIKISNGDQHLLNFENVNMIEEINTDSCTDKKMQELKDKFKTNY